MLSVTDRDVAVLQGAARELALEHLEGEALEHLGGHRLELAIDAIHYVEVVEAAAADLGKHLCAAPAARVVGLDATILAPVFVCGPGHDHHEGVGHGAVHRQRVHGDHLHPPVLLRDGAVVDPHVDVVQGGLGVVPLALEPLLELLDRRDHGPVLGPLGVGVLVTEPLVGEKDDHVVPLELLELLLRVQDLEPPVVAEGLVREEARHLHEVAGLADHHGVAQLDGARLGLPHPPPAPPLLVLLELLHALALGVPEVL
mmetsp:Transcript_93876/g.265810  ORF Transcript_93876/g.265810 Transcript_93876/m.265810 type:complete len:257 (+) Transcript_93876:390-1160(+)